MDTDTYETHDQHYGRGLTKESIKDGLAKFFYNGCCIRKDAVEASIQKVQMILQWFENQSQLHFYASSLLFVYEGSLEHGVSKLNDRGLEDVTISSKGCQPDREMLEYNNNVCVFGSTENGRTESSVGQSLSHMYALHKKACTLGHHDIPLEIKTDPQDNNIWKPTCISMERPNGNTKSQLEKERHCTPTITPRKNEVEVRMIDFAHVFPSTTKDEGYIYGLKNLLTVLQQILNN